MAPDDDLPELLAAIAVGIEPVPNEVVRHGAAAFDDIDLAAYRRAPFAWDVVE